MGKVLAVDDNFVTVQFRDGIRRMPAGADGFSRL
jgi:hypothetical protein